MKKLTGVLLAGLIASQTLLAGATISEAKAYYDDVPLLDGELSRTVTYLYDGVTRTDFVLDNSSKYRRQAFSTVEFDPAQDDLYLDVACGGTYANTLVKTSTTVSRFNENNGEGKTALAAINGDMWLMNNYHVRVEGNESKYVSGYQYEANVTRAITIPRGFSMYGGEIICTTNMEQETPFQGTFQSFGISSDGEALFGNIICHPIVRNNTRGGVATVDGINRLPADDALVMYTDKGYASNYSLSDAYEVIIDCGYDYTVRSGETITGKVTAITKPGETKYGMISNRIILTARGDRTSLLSSYRVGDQVSISVSITDEYGNTGKWQTVTDCVGGHMPIVIDGVSQNLSGYNYPTSIIGIKENGNVVMLTSWGRQGSTYSYGLYISQLDEICEEMGIVTAFLLDGGGSATMVCETDSGYELTGRPCDSGNTERAVVNSVILSVGPSKSGIDDTDITFEGNSGTLMRELSGTTYTEKNGVLTVTAADYRNPSFKLDLFGSSADEYKYMVIEALPTQTGGGTFTLGIYPSGGRAMDPVMSSGVKLDFECDGSWQRKIVDLSSITEWSGRMNFIRMDLFDHSGVGVVGEGISLTRVRFFTTLSAAQAYADGADDIVPGDADGDGRVNLTDVSFVLKKVAGWQVSVGAGADYNRDGKINLTDAVLILRQIAGYKNVQY